MDKEYLKELALKVKEKCLKDCNNCNTKEELLTLLVEYNFLIDEYYETYKPSFIFHSTIEDVCDDYIKVYIFTYYVILIKQAIKQIDINGLTFSNIKHFENFCHDSINRLLKDIESI